MNNIKPLVSISCITYNHAPYIRQCLDGFMMQKTNFPFEVLIHDDCSTDGTIEIIKEYESKYPDIIKPIYEEENQYQNGKPSGSIVWNFPRAKGKYIAMCEGDDYWIDPLKLQKQVDFLIKNPNYGLVYTNSYILRGTSFDLEKGVWGSSDNSYSNLLVLTNPIPTLTVVFRKCVLTGYCNKVEPYNLQWPMGDLPLWLWISFYYKIHFINECTSVYRFLQNSTSHSNNYLKNKKFLMATLDVKLFFYKILPTKLVTEKQIKQPLIRDIFRLSYKYKYSRDVQTYFEKLNNRTFKDYIKYVLSYFF